VVDENLSYSQNKAKVEKNLKMYTFIDSKWQKQIKQPPTMQQTAYRRCSSRSKLKKGKLVVY